jgi:hypothetical protein
MEIPKIELLTNPETKQAKSAVGYEWNDIAGTRHFNSNHNRINNK